MKRVNDNSKQVLDKLWELATQNDGHCKLNNDPTYMPLSIEIIEPTAISLCHYGEQNGDLMRDPEMLFWKDETGNYFPFYFRNDYVGHEDILGETANGKLELSNVKGQADLIELADVWMQNIECQQFGK